MKSVLSVAVVLVIIEVTLDSNANHVSSFGYPVGMFSDCPGVTSKVVITPKSLLELQVIIHTKIKTKNSKDSVYRRRLRLLDAPKILAKDKKLNFNDGDKKTVLYITGFLDSSSFPHTRALADAYADRGYNVLLLEITFFTTRIYPQAVRVSREIGKYTGEFLSNLTELTGLSSDNIELCGLSLGGQMTAYIAETYTSLQNGSQISRIVGLDPAGPCYRTLPEYERLRKGIAKETLIIHTNIDGLGMSAPLGDVDFYVNGGEWQPSDIIEIPCLVMCSHARALIYWIIAIKNPYSFIGIQCKDVQQARDSDCFDNSPRLTNGLGIETNFSRPGIYYLPTWNTFPYHVGEKGLKKSRQVFSYTLRRLNQEDVLIV